MVSRAKADGAEGFALLVSRLAELVEQRRSSLADTLWCFS